MPVPYQITVDALRAESARVEMISNNLVNASSNGFKRGMLLATPFSERLSALATREAAPGTGAFHGGDAVATDFSQGAMTETGDLHHLAIVGEGFFVVREGDQILYTRAGVFHRDEQGRMVNAQGWVLQGSQGDMLLKSDKPRIERDGTVLDGGRSAGQIRVVEFARKAELERVGAASFSSGQQLAVGVKVPTVRQGFLEASNVTTSMEMVQLMESVKRFEFGQRVFQSQDDMLDRAIRRIGEGQ